MAYARDPQLDAAVSERIRRQRAAAPGLNYEGRNFFYTDGSPIGIESLEGYSPEQRGKALQAYTGNQNYLTPNPNAAPVAAPGTQGSADNPFKTISNIKSQPVADQLSGQIDLFKSFNTGNMSNLNDYLTNFGNISKRSVNDFNQESSAINDIYDPRGLRSRLDSNLNDYSRGMKGVANRALSSAMRNLSARQMGGGSTGASSYYGAQAQDAARGIDTQLIADMANRRSQNEQYMTGIGLNAAGVRQRLGQGVLAGLTAPIDVRNRMLGANLDNLRGISAIDQANTFYGVVNPNAGYSPISIGTNNGGGGGGNYGGDFYGGDGGNGGDSSVLAALQKLLQPNRGSTARAANTNQGWVGPQSAQTPGMWSEEDALYQDQGMQPGYTNLPTSTMQTRTLSDADLVGRPLGESVLSEGGDFSYRPYAWQSFTNQPYAGQRPTPAPLLSFDMPQLSTPSFTDYYGGSGANQPYGANYSIPQSNPGLLSTGGAPLYGGPYIYNQTPRVPNIPSGMTGGMDPSRYYMFNPTNNLNLIGGY